MITKQSIFLSSVLLLSVSSIILINIGYDREFAPSKFSNIVFSFEYSYNHSNFIYNCDPLLHCTDISTSKITNSNEGCLYYLEDGSEGYADENTIAVVDGDYYRCTYNAGDNDYYWERVYLHSNKLTNCDSSIKCDNLEEITVYNENEGCMYQDSYGNTYYAYVNERGYIGNKLFVCKYKDDKYFWERQYYHANYANNCNSAFRCENIVETPGEYNNNAGCKIKYEGGGVDYISEGGNVYVEESGFTRKYICEYKESENVYYWNATYVSLNLFAYDPSTNMYSIINSPIYSYNEGCAYTSPTNPTQIQYASVSSELSDELGRYYICISILEWIFNWTPLYEQANSAEDCNNDLLSCTRVSPHRRWSKNRGCRFVTYDGLEYFKQPGTIIDITPTGSKYICEYDERHRQYVWTKLNFYRNYLVNCIGRKCSSIEDAASLPENVRTGIYEGCLIKINCESSSSFVVVPVGSIFFVGTNTYICKYTDIAGNKMFSWRSYTS